LDGREMCTYTNYELEIMNYLESVIMYIYTCVWDWGLGGRKMCTYIYVWCFF
jgi:hypothetical protein